jgi:hypothetical protein
MTTELDSSPETAETNATADTGSPDGNPVEVAGADPATAAVDNAGKPPRDRVQERIDTLTREKYEGLSRAERAEYRAQQAEQRLAEREAEAKTQSVAPANDYPTLESVGWDEAKHAAAVAAWGAKQATQAAKAELAAERAQAQQQQAVQEWQRKQADFIKTNPEYEQKVGSLPPSLMTDELSEVIMESPMGPEVALYLAENIEKLAAISSLPQKSQAREIGRIEAKLEAAKVAPPPVSKAPPPVGRIDGADASTAVSTTDPDSDKLSDDAWFAAERKRMAKLR